ncbi:hypothetical protein Tco_0309385, partial [Tanacetum coccineum]
AWEQLRALESGLGQPEVGRVRYFLNLYFAPCPLSPGFHILLPSLLTRSKVQLELDNSELENSELDDYCFLD